MYLDLVDLFARDAIDIMEALELPKTIVCSIDRHRARSSTNAEVLSRRLSITEPTRITSTGETKSSYVCNASIQR
jgi:hypothetical protein